MMISYNKGREKRKKKIASGLCTRDGCNNRLKSKAYCEKHLEYFRLIGVARYRERKSYKPNPHQEIKRLIRNHGMEGKMNKEEHY